MTDDKKVKKKEEDDLRTDFLCSFVTKSMRLKIDKWHKLMGTEDLRAIVFEWLNQSHVKTLIITMNTGGVLVPMLGFPTNTKTKSCYFIKKKSDELTVDNIRNVCIFGDISPRPVDDLAILVDNVFFPILNNPNNQVGWPVVITNDVTSHMQELRNIVAEVQGNILNLTLLPMPMTIVNVMESAKSILYGGPYDLSLRNSIEGIVIKWSSQIEEVLKEGSISAFDNNNNNPTPIVELNFWRARCKNLENIYKQLCNKRIKTIGMILEYKKSVYYTAFRTTFHKVVIALHEAKDISLWLSPLLKYIDIFESTDFCDTKISVKPLIYCMCLIWQNSNYYNTNEHFVIMFKMFSNLMIEASSTHLDAHSIFKGDTNENLIKLNIVIDIIEHYKNTISEYKGINDTFENPNKPENRWTFKSQVIFSRLYIYLNRLYDLKEIFEMGSYFIKLEKIEILGLNGRNISRKISEVYDKFQLLYGNWANISFNPLSPEEGFNDFERMKTKFMNSAEIYVRTLAQQLLLAFDECCNLDQYIKMIQVCGPILQHPIVLEETQEKYQNIIKLFRDDLNLVKICFEQGVESYRSKGFEGLPIDRGFPPIAGTIMWIRKFKERLTRPFNEFKYVEFPIFFDDEERQNTMENYEKMLSLLAEFEYGIFSDWRASVPVTIKRNLNNFLLARNPNNTNFIELNFNPKLVAIFREMKYLNAIDYADIPSPAIELYDTEETLWDARLKLSRIVEWYNEIQIKTKTCEFNLIADEIEKINLKINDLTTCEKWKLYNPRFIQMVYNKIKNLRTRLLQSQENIQRMLMSINDWGSVPLYVRKENSLLNIDERLMAAHKRFSLCQSTNVLIDSLMEENFILLHNYHELANMPYIDSDEDVNSNHESIQRSETGTNTEEILHEESIPLEEKEKPIKSLDIENITEEIEKKTIDILTLKVPKTEEQLQLFRPYEDYVDQLLADEIMKAINISISYIWNEIQNLSGNNALFEVRLELQAPFIVFLPSFNDKAKCSFMLTFQDLVIDIYNMADLIQRVAQPPESERLEADGTVYCATYETYLAQNKEIEEMKREMISEIQKTLLEAKAYMKNYEQKYGRIWLDDRKEFLDNFLIYGRPLLPEDVETIGQENCKLKENPPTLDTFKQMIDYYYNLYDEILEIETSHLFRNWLLVNMKMFKSALLNEVCKWSNMLKEHLVNEVVINLKELEDSIANGTTVLKQNVTEDDFEILLSIMSVLTQIRDREIDTDYMFEPLREIVDMLKAYNVEFPKLIYDQLNELPEKWLGLKKLAMQVKHDIAPLQAYHVDLISKRIALHEYRQKSYRENFKKLPCFRHPCPDIYALIDKLNDEISVMEEYSLYLDDSAALFELNMVDKTKISACRKDLIMLKQLWDFILVVESCIDGWKHTLWTQIDIEDIEMECKKLTKDILSLDKDMRNWKLFMYLESILKNLLTSLRAITELQNSAIRDRHWIELMHATQVVFKMDESITLADLLDLNLHNYEEVVKGIVDKAVKEMAMESTLNDLKATWNEMSFEFEPHQRTNLEMLKASDELIEILEDHQGQLQNLLSSKYIAYFLEEVNEWQIKLSNTDQIISIWLEVQRKWMYLESIFIGSEDIRSQLPHDSKRFDKIDEKFKVLLQQLHDNPNVVQATNKEGLLEKLDDLLLMLILCEKALNDYLETKRLAFPRFYFVSSADLLDILSYGNQPKLVGKHLTKLYDSIMALKFEMSSKTAVGMFAKENDEYVKFENKCDCTGNVEIWLNRVTNSMRQTLNKLFAAAIAAYDNKARDLWVFDWPAQPALCTTQICWTTDVNIAFVNLEEGYENSLKDYQKKQITLLNALIVLLLGDLSQGDRQKIMTICTIDVHSRDVVAKMILQKVETGAAFQWQSQLRHRWDFKLKDCFANICDAQFKYDYEYLGNTPRLVITPLTDRCYITLTQSLHLVMGGAPAGPAGTGKTETTKDLGRALGIMVYVFNCSEQMDFKSCGNIYKGLAQCGAWGCFDEFNRISIEVLSVVAVQVKTIQDAIKVWAKTATLDNIESKKTVFNFMGTSIELIPTVGIFITMNPGYAGRTELPENVKALFRPCAMVVPDFALISEIMLVAEGFQEARLLARKFITLYTLCKELLSKQDHYDWGLRAIKSVLVVAGSLKRGDKLRPEDQVLMRALRDFNIPKIVTDDVPIFMELIGDLFPSLDIPRKRSMEFEKLIKKSAADLLLQPDQGFVLKVVQLEELFAVRHSVFIVGNAGTGKTQVWKTLNKTYFNQKRKPFFNDLNPKAVTNDELFGIINPATREWKDGLLSVLMRDQANLGGNGPKWIVLDGDIDPMWIESLNTVMDENKVLTLASNERIALTKEMRLLFEIGHLKSATPATVSRAGILYINPQDLGWYPFVASWIQTRENFQEKSTLTMLFDKYVPPLLEVNKRFKKICPISDIAMIQMSCHLLECLLTSQNTPNDCPKEWYEIYFAFALIWGFGSALFQDQLIDWRAEFNKWWLNEFKVVKFPHNQSIFNFFIDPETKKFLPWSDLTPPATVNFDIPLQSMLIPTAETTRLRYFIDILFEKNYPVMLVGGAGSGKSVIVADILNSLPEKYAITNISFNFYTTSEMLQKVLEKPLEKKSGRNFGPPGAKYMIYFVDDMNMPEVDKFGTVQPHTIIRQFMDYQHWYDRTKLTLKDIRNCMFASCMNPTAGSFTIDSRLQRHFCAFAVSYPDANALYHIYNSILSQHMQLTVNKFSSSAKNMCTPLINTALSFHIRLQQLFLPTAIKFHYVFNLRDLANIFTGMLFANGDTCKDGISLVRLWIHEATRVYSDKLVSYYDIDEFKKLLELVVKKGIEEINEQAYSEPLIYCHFAESITEQKYMPIKSWASLQKLLAEAQLMYNEVVGTMNLVLFEDAMCHVCRISRILEAPRGNALLIGVGGSGKQSLANLAAFISALSVFQIQLGKDYTILDMKSDLAILYTKVGIKNIPSMFLMSDAQVGEEQFLVLINDMLASGEIPDLFPDDEIENIVSTLKNEVKQLGLIDTKDTCWKYYIEKVRKMLKIVLCFSPGGSTLRIRARKFPAIVNCTAIDWFHEWPTIALESVSFQFLSTLKSLPSDLTASVSTFMAYAHGTVNDMSLIYLQNEKRYNYTTPKTFLELISLYSKLLTEKTEYHRDMIDRLENGLVKLALCSEQVDGLQETLKDQEIILKVKNEAADKLIIVVSAENEKVKKEKNFANEEEKKVRIIEEDVGAKAKLCEEDLRKAEPALVAAQAALNTLNKNNLTELKSFSSPPDACVMVLAAVIVLFSPKGKINKDRSWKAAKELMGKVDSFLFKLINYDKEHISPKVIEALQPYINNTDFDPDKIFVKSAAAAGLCSWVININKFYHVFLFVEPKQRALKEAQAELKHAQERLMFLNDKIFELEGKLNLIQAEFDAALNEKQKCQFEADKTAFTIDLAHRLVNGLASEKVRWRFSVSNLSDQIVTLPGDVLLISCFISYVGCFTRRYRAELQNKMWFPKFNKIIPEIPHSDKNDPLELICDDAQIAMWNNEGLPNDRMSAENATILTNTSRWPLMIDPQLQGIKWLKQKFGKMLVIIRLSTEGYLGIIEKALANGDVVLLENIGETVDAVLDPLLGRALIKKGTAIKIGDKEIDFNPDFKFILHTKLANPHYKPEMQAQTTLINFTVTRDGLEEQLLAEVVKEERPDLEQLKTNLTMQENHFKISLKALEDDLLRRLSSAGENVLDDPTLVLNLEKTKQTAAEIEIRVAEARITSVQLDETRNHYRYVAKRASILYFILNELYKINPIYQFSLKAFTVVFKNAIASAIVAEKLKHRVANLIESITFNVFMYTTRGLFEKDKLIFIAQMAIQIFIQQNNDEQIELDFLLRFPFTPNLTSPFDFLSNNSWGGIKALSSLDDFRNLDKDIESSTKRWKKFIESETPEREKLPGEWKGKTSLQKLCIMRALRPDRMTYAISLFVEEKVGKQYVEARQIEFAKSFNETNATTPVFFILSPGVDPLKDVEMLGVKLKYTTDRGNFYNVSLGQGQEVIAETAIDIASKSGHWVILQNIHLVAKWLPTLEKKLESTAEESHENYRLFLSGEPAPTPEQHIIPQGILESAIKITNEPPTGMCANVHKALDNFNQETFDMCTKESEFKAILFSLCYFHAVVAERRKFGPQGWNRIYPFNVGDLTISVNVLYNYLEANSKVPWEDLRYLFGEIMYGGHITDDWDRRLCRTYLEEYMQPELMDGEIYYAKGFPAPPNRDYEGYHHYIDDFMPPESPILYGLHSNAEIGFLTTSGEDLLKTIFELQPRSSEAAIGIGASREDSVKYIAEEIIDKLPEEFYLQEIMARADEKTPFIIVACQECERMNFLIAELKRSLKELLLGLKGELTVTPIMERLEDALFFDVVPESWTKLAYPSLLGLQAWFADLMLRLKELEQWAADFNTPNSVWLSGFFNPQSFLTAIMQQTARKNEWPLDKMCLNCEVTKKNKDDITAPPREGAYVNGLFMEGARWNIDINAIGPARLKELYPMMPVIFIKAITQDKQDTKNIYECPVYKTRLRGQTYVWTFNLKTKEKAATWILGGVCLLLQI